MYFTSSPSKKLSRRRGTSSTTVGYKNGYGFGYKNGYGFGYGYGYGSGRESLIILRYFMALFFLIFVVGCVWSIRSIIVNESTSSIVSTLRGSNGNSNSNSNSNSNNNNNNGLNLEPIPKPNTYPYPYKFDSTLDTRGYKVKGGERFFEWKDGDTPYEYEMKQADTIIASNKAARIRRQHVKNAMRHAWKGYKEYAFGYDELQPISGSYNNRWSGIGTTLVDSLDTLYLMGMHTEFNEAREWVAHKLSFHGEYSDQYTSVFETTIRSLGGLLSAYEWSKDTVFLEKAIDLGNRLFVAFDTPSGIPYGEVNLLTGEGRNEKWLHNEVSLSAGTTLQVEYRYLAHVTGRKEYATKAERVYEIMNSISPVDGLYPATVVNLANEARLGKKENKISFGSRADSFYEYMLKIWLQGGRKEQMYRDMYDKSIQGMHDKLLQRGQDNSGGLWYIAQSIYTDPNQHPSRDHRHDEENDIYYRHSKHNHKRNHKHNRKHKVNHNDDNNNNNNPPLDPSFDHLVCFMGGLLALGAYTDPLGLESDRAQRDLKTGKALTYTCYQMYASTNTGLSPEIVSSWDGNGNGFGGPVSARFSSFYMLRPEAVESFYILHELTGDPVYREWGWEVFQSIEKYCKTSIAYGHFPNVQDVNEKPEDNMESFFLSETLKYLYLLFDPDKKVDLEKYVFNTEAHPLRIFEKE